LTGTNLPTNVTHIQIGDKRIKVTSVSSTQIVFNSPSMNPGLYDISVFVGSLGNAM
jgi:hypothetical protein